ncbi:MAG: transcription-repair coupling factor [Oscillospiraceae bacterium]|jgi:transcription-repair coupling factor (superfamily II helicase)|nr:transcription-repair coupling factor [Oscillospiraceae bacterium]
MEFLRNLLLKLSSYKNLCEALDNKQLPASLTGLSDIHKTHFVHTLCSKRNSKAILIAACESQVQKMADDLVLMGSRTLVYPSRDFNFRDIDGQSKEYEQKKISVLSRIIAGNFDVVITSIDAALQFTIPKEVLKRKIKNIKISEEISMQEIIALLISSNYQRYDQVEGKGQFSVRGGILDIFSPNLTMPIRIEFLGDKIESIFHFDPQTQRRAEPLMNVSIIPCSEVILEKKDSLINEIEQLISNKKMENKALKILESELEKLKSGCILSSIDKFIPLIYDKITLFSYFNRETLLFISEPLHIKEYIHATTWRWHEDLKKYLEEGILIPELHEYFENCEKIFSYFTKYPTIYLNSFARSNNEFPTKAQIHVQAMEIAPCNGTMRSLIDSLHSLNNVNSEKYRNKELVEGDIKVDLELIKKSTSVILAGSERSALNLSKDLDYLEVPNVYSENLNFLKMGIITISPGNLSAGFSYPELKFSLLTYKQPTAAKKKKIAKSKNFQAIYSLNDISLGEYVVHFEHGIGIFQGIHKIDTQGAIKDYIKISYAKGDILHIPVTQLDMVSKYIGPKDASTVKINRLGSTDWQKAKTRVRTAVKKMAEELTKIYSERMKAKGHAFTKDCQWQLDFESYFEYEETDDQLRCIDEIKKDMESSAPMDRLLCGDVGFGKTEVALRAAFKCIIDSKQCAMLVPTTILAWQHYQTICRRFQNFPVTVELLSRFRTPTQQADILKKLRRGEIDIVIGTHRLVQKDVTFQDLGLVIIDEEQRFGVAHKEKFKNLYKNVDILTLSATPIPRTLNMAMSGIRDMSIIEEAPSDRYPVQTYVLEHDPVIILEAIRKELRRGGQVYYLHNKVETIERVAAQLHAQLPETKVGVGHGRMSEKELSDVWRKVIDHEIDILVCTTIIETGVDVPNVNTLIIENADHIGLSGLHQIRGRVGRSSRRAYAYFTFKRDKVLSEVSQKRLNSIREFTQFGSGFKIAMRDLELRGAGNILSGEQHGHMADVGYDMYMRLLNEAVNEEKGENCEKFQYGEVHCLTDIKVDAYIPENYINNLNTRLGVYHQISNIRTEEDVADIQTELADRFGKPPTAVKTLLDIALIRSKAAALGIYEIKQKANALLLYKQEIDRQLFLSILGNIRKGVLLNASTKPYISVKLFDKSSLDILKKIFEIAPKYN